MNKLIITVITISLLTGCSTIMRVVDTAAQVNDDAIKTAEFTICNAASVGSIERRYNNADLLKARKAICDREVLVIE